MSDPASGPAPRSGQIVPGFVVVRFAEDVVLGDAAAGTARALPNLILNRVIVERLNMVEFRITDSAPVNDTVDRLVDRATELRIRWAEPSYVVSLCSAPSVPLYPDDPLYPLQWALPHIGASMLWNQVANNVRIAILDSGIPCTPGGTFTHPDLKNNIILTRNYFDPVESYNDRLGHGTEMAGVCGADANNKIGITGVAWNIKKLIYKFLSANMIINSPDIVQAINDALLGANEDGYKVVINLSAGINAGTNQLRDVCGLVHQDGAILCAATGNEGWSDRVVFPAAYAQTNPAVISVGAVDCNNRRAYFSNCAPGCVTLVAPGVGILTCVIGTDQYDYINGTSPATAFASAIIAQLWAKRGGTNDEIVNWVKSHCIALSDSVPSPETGYGLITGIADTDVTGMTLIVTGDDVV